MTAADTFDLGIQDARLLSGWLGSWLRNKA